MPISLKYHDTHIEIPDPPAGEVEILEGKEISAILNPESAIFDALDNPIESPELSEMLPSTRDITILVSDRTRKTRLDILLPAITSYLTQHDVPDDQVKILVCPGTHRKHSEDQLENLIGKDFINRFELIESNQDNPEEFISFGQTSRGIEVKFRRQVYESGLLIVTGGITFHYFAGFSGGRKSFVPGCAHVDTIQKNHSLTYLEQDGKVVRNSNCKSMQLDGNPVHEDMVDAFNLIDIPSFLVNVILTLNGEIAGIFAGDVVDAHLAGCSEFSRLYSLPIERKADIIIASAGGYPTDINLLQSHKSMINASQAVKPGGTIFLAANCIEGANLGDYPEFMKNHSREELLSRLVSDYEILGGTTDNLMSIAEEHRLFLVSSLDRNLVSTLGVKPFEIESGNWDYVFEGLNSNSLCYIMPNASKFLPVSI